jgi:hypothetical protein
MATSLATASIAAGTGLLAWAVWRNAGDLRRPLSDPTKALGLARWLRTTILGLAAVAVGLGGLWDSWVVIGLALVIAGEETLETSAVIRAMERYPGMARESLPRDPRRGIWAR